MDELSRALAAMNAIYNLLDQSAATLTQELNGDTLEHVIRLEYRFTEPTVVTTDRAADDERKARSMLRFLLEPV